MVATVRALKHSGIENLKAHIDHLNHYNVPFCVAINHFFDDSSTDIESLKEYCSSLGVTSIVTSSFEDGGRGSLELAKYVRERVDSSFFQPLYSKELSIEEKILKIAKEVYAAKDVIYSKEALEKLEQIKKLGVSSFPVCMAKTPFSISDDKNKLGYPKDYSITVKDIRVHTGSEMVVVLLNDIITMPGLPKHPNFESM